MFAPAVITVIGHDFFGGVIIDDLIDGSGIYTTTAAKPNTAFMVDPLAQGVAIEVGAMNEKFTVRPPVGYLVGRNGASFGARLILRCRCRLWATCAGASTGWTGAMRGT